MVSDGLLAQKSTMYDLNPETLKPEAYTLNPKTLKP